MIIKETYVYEGPLYEGQGTDGPKPVFDYFVGVTLLDGRELTHTASFSPYEEHRAKTLAAKVEREGVINSLSHWTEANPWDQIQAKLAEIRQELG